MKKLIVSVLVSVFAMASAVANGIVGNDQPERSIKLQSQQISPRIDWSDWVWEEELPKIKVNLNAFVRSKAECDELGEIRNWKRLLLEGKIPDYINGPGWLNPVTYLMPEDLVFTSFPYYRGFEFQEAGCSRRGTKVSGVIHLESRVPFDAGNLGCEIYTTENYQHQIFSGIWYPGSFSTFSDKFVGIWWGLDGRRGTRDDEIYDRGSVDGRTVNELVYIGPWGATTDSLSAVQKRFGAECKYVVLHYWMEQGDVTLFDEEIRLPIGWIFNSDIHLTQSQAGADQIRLQILPKGRERGFLWGGTDPGSLDLLSPVPIVADREYIFTAPHMFFWLRAEPWWVGETPAPNVGG